MNTIIAALLAAAAQTLFVILIMLTTRGIVTWLLPTDASRLARCALGMVIGLPLAILLGRLHAAIMKRTL